MLTVLTWFWSQPGGRTTYTAHHVNCWAAMVRRNTTVPHRIACVTSHPDGLDPRIAVIEPTGEFEDLRIPTWSAERPQCLRRIAMWRRDAARWFGDRFACMDMDCVVGGSLDPLLSRTEDVVLYRSPPQDGDPNPRPYNGSFMLMTAGARPQVHERLTEAGAIEAGRRYVGSDQAWISHVLGRGEATVGEEDGVAWWGRVALVPESRLLFFPGWPKPWDVRETHPWVRRHYRGDRGGRCLVLGYGPGVWDDLAASLRNDDRPYDAVVSSPEAARHWPGEILAIAGTDAEADQLTAMCGFDEVVFCGRSSTASAA